MSVKGKKVFVGMSGGVDSSVTAYLLRKQGSEVVGVFIKVWEPEGLPCTWRQERRDAMRVAARLDIPLFTLDLSREYKKAVVDYLVAEYRAGRTPNPDVMCNKQIKFGAFYDWAIRQGADFVATGHYAKNEFGKLKISADQIKDQTYFLWNLTGAQLKHVLFPIGIYQKSQVRQLAAKAGLPTAAKKDSQGLCFIGKLDFTEFLKTLVKTQPGQVLNEKGEIIGRHEGVALYTPGQRHGFLIEQKSADDKPHYVLSKDLKNNTLTVTTDLKQSAEKNNQRNQVVKLSDVNWVAGEPTVDKIYQARLRYRQPLQACRLEKSRTGNRWLVKFDAPQAILPSGQSLVVYDGEICLGGGVIN
ncbi:MAG: tRNA 2-thiouridine(34) synthase MnmA [Candidatus Vogelbacteria bacterium CG10_big_fil_rev_8_21_14_0_10_49_38]|uniref:tRNA-specific 2-thiouridylase MnmA n=1 Tax=Candidatus Vogelbacteria bacterium CG10_big_fil_rev_8_21_14_0_10_49_38 TaxID=1975043 RepID=A0A2H0RHA0_9BACT|nr:MAG: tRNA 2-thiouridine(34) synthase MnmA [bacterium CG10_49_38]PIR45873.1 MAG: tRNA 2-thiouridine(34) synthase MnmA [Candidatus Vogelbacteria bacterium CG10_big_fil_rev_8_21_14_0_10_49_38]